MISIATLIVLDGNKKGMNMRVESQPPHKTGLPYTNKTARSRALVLFKNDARPILRTGRAVHTFRGHESGFLSNKLHLVLPKINFLTPLSAG